MTERNPDYQKAHREASKLLEDLMISDAPVIATDIASALGLSVYEVDMPKGMESIAGFFDFDSNEIIVNKADSINRKNFTIAHEIGHFKLHQEEIKKRPTIYRALLRTSNFGDNNSYEKEANHFAAELLAPSYLIDKYKDAPDSIKSKIFLVSPTIFKYKGRK